MNIADAIRRTRDLLAAQGLGHIDVVPMRRSGRIAECRFRRDVPWGEAVAHTIALSTPHFKANDWTALRGVVLHEIAHAVAGYEAGHGPAFVNVAIALGGIPTAAHTLPNQAAGGWHSTCPMCGQSIRKARLASRRFHCRCTRTMAPESRPFLTWKHEDGREGTCLSDVRQAL